jgi:hypothetical protein
VDINGLPLRGNNSGPEIFRKTEVSSLRDSRMRSRLRLFVGAEASDLAPYQEPEVSMKLGELTRILADAIIWDRTWIADFADDDVRISADLFDVLSTYSQMRPSA